MNFFLHLAEVHWLPEFWINVPPCVSLVRTLLDVPDVSHRQLSDTIRTLVWKSVQRFSGSSKSLGSPRLSASSSLYSWVTLSPRSRRTSSRTRLDGTILRNLSRIFRVATRSLWSVRANSALRNFCSSGRVSSDRLHEHGRSLSLQHRYRNTKSSGASPVFGTKI